VLACCQLLQERLIFNPDKVDRVQILIELYCASTGTDPVVAALAIISDIDGTTDALIAN
jgi:hypothetical protein